MKTGMTLQELARTVIEQQQQKRDFISDTRLLEVKPDARTITMQMENEIATFIMNGIFQNQLAEKTGVPVKYFNRMIQEAPELLAVNVNHWLKNSPAERMIRTLGETARAFLGSRYRCIDNFDLMEAVLPTLQDQDLEVKSCSLTDQKLYLKATVPSLVAPVKAGDLVCAGVIIRNSETGCGLIDVSPFTENLSCTNGAVWTKYGMNRRHIGRQLGGNGDSDNAREIFSDEAKEVDDKAFFLKVRDVVKATCTREMLDILIYEMKEAQDIKITKPVQCVEVASKKLNLSKTEQESVLMHLVNNGDLSAYGLAQAVTRTAQDAESYDRATELEEAGITVVDNATSLVAWTGFRFGSAGCLHESCGSFDQLLDVAQKPECGREYNEDLGCEWETVADHRKVSQLSGMD